MRKPPEPLVIGSPPAEARKLLTGKLIAFGAIPIAVFCAIYLVASRLIGLSTPEDQVWTLSLGLLGSVASLFVMSVFAARAAVGEVQAVREALHHVVSGVGGPELPELTPPLEDLKKEVLGLTQDLRAEHARMQQGLDIARQQIFFLTNHDPLTGLPNRKAFEERLETALASARASGATHALLYLDIDFFHRINDSFGHLAGDELLRRLAPVLQKALREGETLARIGGDEFAVLLQNCGPEFALAAALQLRDAVQAWRFEWGDKAYQVGVSVGVVAITRLAPSLSAVLSEADNACFTAKEQGRNRVFAFHDASTSATMRQTSRGWAKRINDALGAGTFTLLYQPIVPIDGPKAGGNPRVEALLRMSETGGELILPMSFIPAAERYDLMRGIDRWVVERAFSDYRRLAKARENPSPAEFSINLSGHTLSSPEFAAFLQEKFAQYGVPAQCVWFEITETAAIANVERARSLIEQLRSMGVRFILDDFGTGLASFNYLKQFPVDGVKIDGQFVKGMGKSYLDFAMVEAMFKIGQNLGLQTIAEAVENEDIARKLAMIGVQLGQGYHLGAPRPWETLLE